LDLRGSRPNQLLGIAVVEQWGNFVQIRSATKIRILCFYPVTVEYSREEENRQLEKLHSTLKVFVDSPAAVLRLVVARSAAPLPEAWAGLLVPVFWASFPRLSLSSHTSLTSGS